MRQGEGQLQPLCVHCGSEPGKKRCLCTHTGIPEAGAGASEAFACRRQDVPEIWLDALPLVCIGQPSQRAGCVISPAPAVNDHQLSRHAPGLMQGDGEQQSAAAPPCFCIPPHKMRKGGCKVWQGGCCAAQLQGAQAYDASCSLSHQVLPSPGAPQCAHTAPVAAVLLVQVVGQPPLEGNLYPLLHVLEPAVHHGCWDGHACKGCQATRKALKVLQAGWNQLCRSWWACWGCRKGQWSPSTGWQQLGARRALIALQMYSWHSEAPPQDSWHSAALPQVCNRPLAGEIQDCAVSTKPDSSHQMVSCQINAAKSPAG